MPILSDKNNPPSKSFECSILEKLGTWWVAKVKPRQEKAFAFDLLEQGIDYYLPFYEKKTKRSDGKFRKSTLVLFPSYVPFLSENPFGLLRQNRIATILPITDQKKFRAELNQISLAQESSVVIHPHCLSEREALSGGAEVRISSGILKGLTGSIVSNQKKFMILTVTGLGSVKVIVNHQMLSN